MMLPERLTLRAGLFYETGVADAACSLVDFPGGPQMGGSLGTSLFFGRWELALAYQARFQSSVHIAEAAARVYQQVPGSACQAPYRDPNGCNPHYLGQPAPAVNARKHPAQPHFPSLAVLYRLGGGS